MYQKEAIELIHKVSYILKIEVPEKSFYFVSSIKN